VRRVDAVRVPRVMTGACSRVTARACAVPENVIRMLNRLGFNGPGEAEQRDPGSNNTNHYDDGTEADAMAEHRERELVAHSRHFVVQGWCKFVLGGREVCTSVELLSTDVRLEVR
jgi:hypothetical protein